ncbi:bacillithiol biosynthesis cysteine-adding enzyme BshC [Sutcliffiella halmapala]|uniref:bacillithiol biosynthesis cysteine-adding enzyme BshC n=1 Tax=Sutcliffiella halmapala TaxID=79882 RepID=UPI0014763FD2|nr:bacillithiol biosynthesis cysteine-adding enzyme BshC [Sutcliffiella halmapala]
MNIVELSLPTINKFSSAYLSEKESIHRFFTYNPFSTNTFEQRKNALKHRSFKREELADHLINFNKKYQADEKTLHNIERFRKHDSLVVIGGQQAGLLTGPVYTISKIISIIKLAEEQEKMLEVPVVPVFWIAGEDHDYHEINHIHVPQKNEIEKITLHMKSAGKKMVSELPIDKVEIQEWLDKVINSYGETAYTKDIKSMLERALQSSNNVVDFFAELITTLFRGTGLILVNASDLELRKLETSYFQQMLVKHEQITREVLNSQDELIELGFTPMLEIQRESMNLFYHQYGERELLYWNEENQIATTKDAKITFTLVQLMKLIEDSPEKFSNNVVTRPLMEECLFPTLAFIGGPGEISYWAELKNAFQVMDIEMPPVMPRIGLTFLERHIASTIEELEEDLEDILNNGLEEKRKAWLLEQELGAMESQLELHYEKYRELHGKFKGVGQDLLPHLEPVFEKNRMLIDKQFQYIKRLMERSAYEKHENMMKKYHRVELSLIPKGMPQERIWNIYYYLNEYGMDVVQRICEMPLRHNGKHKIIYL